MRSFNFWQMWLFGFGLIIVIFGLALAFFSGSPLFSVFNQNIDPIFWGKTPPPPAYYSFRAWVYAVLGATMAGWGVCVAFMARYPFQRRETWAWNALAAAVLLWFCVDTAFSISFGVYINAAFNTFILVAAALPLAFTRRLF